MLTSGSPSPRWLSSSGVSSEKLGDTIAGRLDPPTDHDLLAQTLSRGLLLIECSLCQATLLIGPYLLLEGACRRECSCPMARGLNVGPSGALGSHQPAPSDDVDHAQHHQHCSITNTTKDIGLNLRASDQRPLAEPLPAELSQP